MNTTTKQSFKFIIGTQYFLYFSVLGIFCRTLIYTAIISGSAAFNRRIIGLAICRACFVSPYLGGTGRSMGKRRPIYIFCTIFSTSIWVFYLFTIEFWPILLITIFYGMFYAPIISFLKPLPWTFWEGKKELRTHTGMGFDQLYHYGCCTGQGHRPVLR